MKCLSCVLPELHFSFFIITRCMYGMHNGDHTQANPRFLFVCTNSEFKPVFESLLIHKKETKKRVKKKKKAFLHCTALQSTDVCQQPCCSDGAAHQSCHGRNSDTTDGYIESVCVCVSGLSGSLRPHVLLSTAPLEAGPRELQVSLLKIQLLSIIKCSLFEPEEVL